MRTARAGRARRRGLGGGLAPIEGVGLDPRLSAAGLRRAAGGAGADVFLELRVLVVQVIELLLVALRRVAVGVGGTALAGVEFVEAATAVRAQGEGIGGGLVLQALRGFGRVGAVVEESLGFGACLDGI